MAPFRYQNQDFRGIYIALLLLILWGSFLTFSLFWFKFDLQNPLTYLLILIQTHFYTGIFITAHDGMHGTIAPFHKKLNHFIGKICTVLFAFNSYRILHQKHHLHHRFAGTIEDPDWHHGHFWAWYLNFAKQYVTWQQIVLMAITYNLLKLAFPYQNLIAFWMLPAVLSTFQLFYFGTYTPHKNPPNNLHRSRSLSKNHTWAFLSCYFFGYHYEHHDSPHTPWWKLYQKKSEKTSSYPNH